MLPVSVIIAEETVLIYPWDPEYEAYKRGAIDQTALGASHGRPSTPSDNTTRLVYRGGLWLPYVKCCRSPSFILIFAASGSASHLDKEKDPL